jgi:hypothetical protein
MGVNLVSPGWEFVCRTAGEPRIEPHFQKHMEPV